MDEKPDFTKDVLREQIKFNVTEEEKGDFEETAKAEGVSLSHFVRTLVKTYVYGQEE